MDRHGGGVVFSGCMGESRSYGLVLLPGEPARGDFIGFARSLALGDVLMRLGVDAPPHVTVLHFRTDAETADRVFRSLAVEAPQPVAVTAKAPVVVSVVLSGVLFGWLGWSVMCFARSLQ